VRFILHNSPQKAIQTQKQPFYRWRRRGFKLAEIEEQYSCGGSVSPFQYYNSYWTFGPTSQEDVLRHGSMRSLVRVHMEGRVASVSNCPQNSQFPRYIQLVALHPETLGLRSPTCPLASPHCYTSVKSTNTPLMILGIVLAPAVGPSNNKLLERGPYLLPSGNQPC
jgi:hypothetical protein